MEINIEKLDDIQLSIYLAQKNWQGQGVGHITNCAEHILDWIKDKRENPERRKEPEVKPSTEAELMVKQLRADMYEEFRNLEFKKLDNTTAKKNNRFKMDF